MNENEIQEVQAKATEIEAKEEKVPFLKKVGNGIKSAGAKVKKTMSDHPIATAVGGAIVGSAATIGGAILVNKAINRNSADDYKEDPYQDDPSVEDTDLDDINDTNVDV